EEHGSDKEEPVSTATMKSARSAGILMHPTSLPGPYGIGDIGPTSYEWVDVLARAGQTWWQILPLGPTGFGDSPYQCFSAFAGNSNLISPDLLVKDQLFAPGDLAGIALPADRVDYGPVINFKTDLLSLAWQRFRAGNAAVLRARFQQFRTENKSWLDGFTLFMALKDAHNGASWQEWPRELRLRHPRALENARRQLDE